MIIIIMIMIMMIIIMIIMIIINAFKDFVIESSEYRYRDSKPN